VISRLAVIVVEATLKFIWDRPVAHHPGAMNSSTERLIERRPA
jgi:hypothetical protein